MEIKSKLTNHYFPNQDLPVVYRESNPMEGLTGKVLQGVHAYCFYGEKMVLVHNAKTGSWTPPGGGIEPGETYEQAVAREVKEETNMKVLYQELIGYQDITEPHQITRQTRSFCLVEPFGDFVSDPDGDIDQIKLIDPRDYKNYFNWGVIGDRIMERAVEMKNKK